ncbi:MAG TPA: RIP metalloprotease RseP [Rhodothermales bacterium]
MEAVLEILSYIFWVMVAIMILVFVHEMGHYLFAKLFKMRVERFSIGFPPKIVGKKVGETEYVIGATPLGGYVKIAGMVDESMDTDFLESEPQPWEFRAKPVWQRIVVITAGVIFNMILAWVIFAGLRLAHGDRYVPAENISAVYVEEGSIAYDMGLRTGDRVVAVGGDPIERYSDIEGAAGLIADPMTITVERDGERLTFEGPDDIMTQLQRANFSLGISAQPSLIGGVISGSPADSTGLLPGDRVLSIGGDTIRYWAEMTHRLQQQGGTPVVVRWARPDTVPASAGLEPVGRIDGSIVYQATIRPMRDEELGRYLLGVGPPTEEMLAEEWGAVHESYSLPGAVSAGFSETLLNARLIVVSLQRMVTGRENVRENLGGPLMIAKVTKQAADAGASSFWQIVALLSITLAIMNILPIPALDGGHLMFLVYEGITRREPSAKVRMVMQQVGMFLILVLMTFLIFNDILKF